MKSSNLFIIAIFTVLAGISACNTKKNKDIIIAKWRVSGISGKSTESLPDSIKDQMFKDASIEFKKDGKYETIGMGGGNKTGTWHFTADEKTLITTEAGSTYTDTVKVVELSAGKLVVEDIKGEMKIRFKSN